MSGFCALYSWNGTPCDQSLLTHMGTSLSQRGDVTGLWSQGSIGLLQAEWSTKGTTHLPYSWQDGTFCVAADIRLDNRRELLSQLPDDQQCESDTALLAAAYRQWGEQCVYHLHGDYAFVLWDAQKHHLFGARSPMGLRPFVYYVSGQRILCASEAKHLFEDPTISKELNPTWIAMWLTQWVDHWGGTIFCAIQELLPGHVLLVNEQGVRIAPFWKPSPRSMIRYRHQQDYTEHFRQLLFEAVSCRIHAKNPFLCDVSGGLDSSSIACIIGELGKRAGKPYPMHGLHAYSSTFGEQDDRALVRPIAERYTLQMHYLSYEEFPAFDGIFRPRPWIDTPTFPTLFLTDLYQAYWQIAREYGIRQHLRGDFGDQLFSATPRYLSAYVDEHRYGTLLGELARWKQEQDVSLTNSVYQSVVKPWLHRRKEQKTQRPGPWLRPSIWEAYAQQQRQDHAYLRQQCPDPLARVIFQHMLSHTEYTAMQADGIVAAGIETMEPYTDMRLIEFLLACPAQYQLRFGCRKFLLRETMQGLLPEPIRTRQSKGRFARLYFHGIARHHKALQDLVGSMPEMLRPYLDVVPLVETLDRVASGDTTDQSTFFSALALILWAHRLPWIPDGKLPR